METKQSNVAIIGRPNVGKSRLFNRLIGRRRAVIDNFEGVTRDIIIEKLNLENKTVNLIDTGGMGLETSKPLSYLIQQKVLEALRKAQVIIFVCDVLDGVTSLDKEIAQTLRKKSKKVILVVNKCDNPEKEKEGIEFYSLGLGEPIPVSAIHGRGIDKLLKELSNSFKKRGYVKREKKSKPIKISIIGRPNVGKSSFLNSLLNQNRTIVDSKPGTTRDSIHTELTYKKKDFLLIDTAGIKHKSKVSDKVIMYSIKRTEDSIEISEVCLILVDGWEGLVKDDMRIIDKAYQWGRGCIIVVNKWDLIQGITSHQYEQALIRRMKKIQNIPVIFSSAKNNINTVESLDLAKAVYANLNQWLPTSDLNKIVKQAYQKHLPPSVDGIDRLKIYYLTQIKTSPPVIKVFVNKKEYIKESYISYLERNIRENFFLKGVPLRFVYKTAHNRRRGRKTEDRGQKTEDRRQKTEDRGQKSEGRKRRMEWKK